MQFQVPVLFLIFNRPDTTQKVFERIRLAQPKQLFIAADGPRYPIRNDYDLCQQARSIALQVDWQCEVKILHQDRNLGVGRGGAEGITWFFEHVAAGIILEDDCIPSRDFFEFCARGLTQFEHDKTIMMLAGTNYHFGKYEKLSGFYRSRHYAIWGWATWRRAWEHYSYSLDDWGCEVSFRDVKHFFGNTLIALRWAKIFDDIKNGRLEAWDAQWIYACVKYKGLSVTATSNLISNVGYFGGHAGGAITKFHDMPYQSIDVKKSLGKELSEKKSAELDFETYNCIGFLHKEPIYKILAQAIMRRVPFLRMVYKCVKQIQKID